MGSALQAVEVRRIRVGPRLGVGLKGFRALWQCAFGCAGLAAVTLCGLSLHLPLATVGSLDLLVVFAMALLGGFWQASMISILAVLSLDYYFTVPLFHFDVADPQDWMSLATFEAAALIISRLSAKELRSAREAALHRTGMEQLYELSRSSLLLDLHRPPGPQIVVLVQRIFHAQAVALYDGNLGRLDCFGEWRSGERNRAKDCFLQGKSSDEPETGTSERLLMGGQGTVGALVVRGDLRPVIADALAALAAMAIDRFQSYEKEERAENASRSEEMRAAVMDALAHEFKTPLAAVRTASSGLIEFGGLSESQSEMASLIEEEITRMSELCTRLLLTAKLEPGTMGLKTSEVNVRELLDMLFRDKSGNSDSNDIEVCVEDPSMTIHADRGLLAMILNQYVDNACKYSTRGTQIKIEARRSYSEILFSVHNYGSTIRLDERERIFDRFYRSPDHAASTPGTGIGLSVVRKAASAHHGHVWVVSDDKEGTTFFLSLPEDARRSQ